MIIALVLILIVVVAVFSVQNASVVSLTFLAWHFETSLALVVLISLLIGMLAGMVFVWWTRIRRTSKEKKEKKPQEPGLEKPV
jgi:putative membrane protein